MKSRFMKTYWSSERPQASRDVCTSLDRVLINYTVRHAWYHESVISLRVFSFGLMWSRLNKPGFARSQCVDICLHYECNTFEKLANCALKRQNFPFSSHQRNFSGWHPSCRFLSVFTQNPFRTSDGPFMTSMLDDLSC